MTSAAWKSCPKVEPHARHEWIEGALRRDCPGVPEPVAARMFP